MTIRFPITVPELGAPELAGIKRVLESGWVAQGPMVRQFEEAVASYCGATNAVAVSSCTAALHLALVCAGIGPGDEVVVPSMSFIATANAVVHAGGTPVFADVDPRTYNLDIEDVARRLGPNTRAVILVHQLGIPGDIDAFVSLCAAHGLTLIEDAACAIGSTYHGRRIGGSGEFVCFSFHPRKLVTTGEGGMVLTDSTAHAQRVRRLRHQGMDISDLERHRSQTVQLESYPEVGFNYRMTDLQAAVGVEQVRRLPGVLTARQALAGLYDTAFEDRDLVRSPWVPHQVTWNVQSYSVQLPGIGERRSAVMQYLLDHGVASRPGVMLAHRQLAYLDRARGISLPNSIRASAESLILPLHTRMTPEDCQFVAEVLVDALDRER